MYLRLDVPAIPNVVDDHGNVVGTVTIPSEKMPMTTNMTQAITIGIEPQQADRDTTDS